MSKLYFKYGCMNSSKSANLLMIKHNYEEQGFRVSLLKSGIDTRDGNAVVRSRIGIEAPCSMVPPEESVYDYFDQENTDILMVDEVQFMTEKQIEELYQIFFDINVLCFGLLTDFKQHLFPGSKRLMELAESFQEIKTVCKCGRRATYNIRLDEHGKVIRDGDQIEIGGNDKYRAVCKTCYQNYYDEK